MQRTETIVIGGGQAGLAMSHLLTDAGRDHVVLERSTRIGETWRSRWDSFTLVTPNWTLRLPGHEYRGDEPDSFSTREQVVSHLEDYAASFGPPLRTGVEVSGIEADDGSYVVRTSEGDFAAPRVVVAGGTFQRARVPAVGNEAPVGVTQMHSRDYRNPASLPEGGVLVVGSGQSGAQIALELLESGRDVYLCVGGAGRLERRYRGRDTTRWLGDMGFFDQTVDDLDSPAERFQANPHVSGRDGGMTLNLHWFARDGMTLLGRLEGFDGGHAVFRDDLHEKLEAADTMAGEMCAGIDAYIKEAGIDAPEEELPTPRHGFEQPQIDRLDLSDAGIGTILWAAGHRFDFGWVEPAELDDFGYPIQRRGITNRPGLYFLGLHWMHTIGSGLFYGVGDDARHIAEHIDSG
jgi:putative flavoprotein involved in K+ transport